MTSLQIHPFLIGVYPIVFLLSTNIDQSPSVGSAAASAGVVVAVTAGLFALLGFGFKSTVKGAFATSGLLVLFFSFGHVRRILEPLDAYHEESLLLVWATLMVLLLAGIQRLRSIPASVTASANLVAFGLVAVNLVPVVTAVGSEDLNPRASEAQARTPSTSATDRSELRDIYYIIFDRYASAPTLRDIYGFDNTGFLGFLEGKGFYLTDSFANYPETWLSLASSLNMRHLVGLAQKEGPGFSSLVYPMLEEFRVADLVQDRGYQYIHMGSWWEPTRADPSADSNLIFGRAEFTSLLLETTLWPTLAERVGLEPPAEMEDFRRVLYQFRELQRVEEINGPTFTFAHFISPHPPYVFSRDGDFRLTTPSDEGELKRAYLDQLVFLNSKIEELVETLLDGPASEDPIVVIQSDEGPDPIRFNLAGVEPAWTRTTTDELRNHLRILNALFVPGMAQDQLYQGISPVNTFRLLFNFYLGTDLRLLPDRSYIFDVIDDRYRFFDVTDRVSTDGS